MLLNRYSRACMRHIWSEENRIRWWMRFQSHVCDALAELGTIPSEHALAIRDHIDMSIDLERIHEIERETHHESVSFLRWFGECVGEPAARSLHVGITSSDMLDTCFNRQLQEASDSILGSLDALAEALRRRAMEFKHAPCIGRSHGVHAEPMTFGLKLARACAETRRNRARMRVARDEISVGMVSGAVGHYAHIDPRVEAQVCDRLSLTPETISSQIVPRDRLAAYFATLAVIASSLERLAIEIRLLQQTEILEVAEGFGTDQAGSSSMPHKRNPILCENVTGLARLVRSAATPAFENVVLWHERDMSHSSVERNIAPDATATLDFALRRLTGVIETLTVYPETMKRNLWKLGGLHASQPIMLALIKAGLDRGTAYALVRSHATKAWGGSDFLTSLASDPAVTTHLSMGELERLVDPDSYVQRVDEIFERVFGP